MTPKTSWEYPSLNKGKESCNSPQTNPEIFQGAIPWP